VTVENFDKVPRIYLDLDGPLADYEKAAMLAGVHPKDAKKIKHFYRDLPVTEGARLSFNYLLSVSELSTVKFEIWCLTKCPKENVYSATDKLLWIDENFPEIGSQRVILSRDKGVVGTRNDLLVDDHPEWANAMSFPGTVIKFVDWPSFDRKKFAEWLKGNL
jgi:5'(3')-deoxyribonucleotidase